MGLVATLGFVTLFGSVGLIISAGGRFIRRVLPDYWEPGSRDLALVLLGLFLLISRKHLSILARQPVPRARGQSRA